MIMRLFLLFGIVLLGVTGYFTVVEQPPAFQASLEESSLAPFQAEGILPTGDLAEDEELEHGVFDVPAMDEMMLENAMASGGMAGMDMGAMDMDGDATMTMPDGTTMPMAEMGDAPAAMDMDGDATMTMPDGTTMPMAEMGEAPAAMDMDGDATMPMAEMVTAIPVGEGGLGFAEEANFDREIKLSMLEWSFSDLNIDVKQGERIKFTVRNDGKILHEFMFMTMPAMQAVTYRAKRADWNLLEHEALFEKSLVLPGAEFSFVVEIQQTGGWMFMCMVPYHMQMGMMGQMATEGMAMPM